MGARRGRKIMRKTKEGGGGTEVEKEKEPNKE
jgi:hypothetical protein